jgi:hypothetical protein
MAVLFFVLWLWAEIQHADTQAELEDLRDTYIKAIDSAEMRHDEVLKSGTSRIAELEAVNEKLLTERAAIKAAISDIGGIDVPETPKFAVGDRVEIIDDGYNCICDESPLGYEEGCTGRITAIDPNGDIWVYSDTDTTGDGEPMWFRELELRKVG